LNFVYITEGQDQGLGMQGRNPEGGQDQGRESQGHDPENTPGSDSWLNFDFNIYTIVQVQLHLHNKLRFGSVDN